MSDEQKPGDPADRAADGAFGGVQSHRSGYGDDKLARLTEWLRAHPTATLASGEGALLLGEIDQLRQRAERAERIAAALRADRESLSSQLQNCTYDRDGWKRRAERFERILAALREPSEQVKKAVGRDEFMRLFTGEWETIPVGYDLTAAMILAAVTAAEKEVGRE